jgi:hypothetical protein
MLGVDFSVEVKRAENTVATATAARRTRWPLITRSVTALLAECGH